MTTWWNINAESRIDEFKNWVGDFNKPSKIYCRKYIANKQYRSIIDCGCGLASEYFGYKDDQYNIDYTGLDSCDYFNTINIDRNIKMINAELEQDLPIQDGYYECVYCREVLEHLSDYQKTLSEFIRIASKEVIIVFFLTPEDEKISFWEEEDLYHNKYDKNKLEKFVLNNVKVDSLFWNTVEEITDRKDVLDETNTEKVQKTILHILLKV